MSRAIRITSETLVLTLLLGVPSLLAANGLVQRQARSQHRRSPPAESWGS
jgi:hypothetical protein